MIELEKAIKTTARYSKILKENGITSLKDFLQYFPRTYEDRTHILPISKIPLDGQTVSSIKAQVIEKKTLPRGNKKIYEVTMKDEEENFAYISFFNSYYQVKNLEKDTRYIITGKGNFKYGKIIFSHPEVAKAHAPNKAKDEKEQHNIGRIYPIYPELQGIKPNRFAKKMRLAIKYINQTFSEHFPKEFLKEFNLIDTPNTIKNMHYPENEKDQRQAIKRIFFDRLLRIQLISQLNKYQYHKNTIKTDIPEIDRETIKNFLEKLPFELTQAQKKSLKSVIEEIHNDKAMLKLLQGDVGSGKTIVAATAAFYSKKIFNAQSVFLAPLEVLASQHHKNLAKLLLPLGIRV